MPIVRRPPSGPDPAFPRLSETERIDFPPPLEAKSDSLICWGGNLSPGMLLSAYEQGLFPWYNEGDPVLWHSPDPRFVLFPEKLHIAKSMHKVMNQHVFEIVFDKDFEGVIRGCAEAPRPGQDGTWITRDIISAYCELYSLGFAHCVASYREGELAGGSYGIRLGNAYFGESMFARVSNASKASFITLAKTLFADGVEFIDCQVHTDYLESFGAEEIPRAEYLRLLAAARADRDNPASRRGRW